MVGRLDELRAQLTDADKQSPGVPAATAAHQALPIDHMPIRTIMPCRVSIGPTAVLAIVAAVAGCDALPQGGAAVAPAAAAEHQPVHVDSIFPIEEEIRRFRAALPDSAAALEGGAASIDELVARFLDALEARDLPALGGMAMTPAEFVYLYYPSTRFTRRPYELSPALVWFQLENYGSKGLNRALTRHGGKPLDSTGYTCPAEPEVEGENRIWSGCIVHRVDPESGDTTSLSLFGGIIERDSRFKFINYANRI